MVPLVIMFNRILRYFNSPVQKDTVRIQVDQAKVRFKWYAIFM